MFSGNFDEMFTLLVCSVLTNGSERALEWHLNRVGKSGRLFAVLFDKPTYTSGAFPRNHQTRPSSVPSLVSQISFQNFLFHTNHSRDCLQDWFLCHLKFPGLQIIRLPLVILNYPVIWIANMIPTQLPCSQTHKFNSQPNELMLRRLGIWCWLWFTNLKIICEAIAVLKK